MRQFPYRQAGPTARNRRLSRTWRASLSSVALGAALIAAPAQATLVLPLPTGGVEFHGFNKIVGSIGVSIDASCGDTFFGSGMAICTGPVFYAGGELGPGIHVTGTAAGVGLVTGDPVTGPRVESQLDVTGGDEFGGAGRNRVTTQLTYYATVVPLGHVPTSGLKIPLTFKDSGSVDASAPSIWSVGAFARTFVNAFDGSILVDGVTSGVSDGVDKQVDGGVISQSYANEHTLLFDFSQGDTVAQVDLSAECQFASLFAGHGEVHCTAIADPVFSFDQAAFDAQMGDKTFKLADFFAIEVSPGLDPVAGVPEPAAWALMIVGVFGVGAAMRGTRRRLATAI